MVAQRALYASIKSSCKQNQGVSGTRATELSTPASHAGSACNVYNDSFDSIDDDILSVIVSLLYILCTCCMQS
jgi:hypothetical protein